MYLPDTLHQRLQLVSKDMGKSVSRLVTDLLDKALAMNEDIQLNRLYKAMDKVKGISKGGPTDVASTINETLYGENGMWRGSEPANAKE